MSAITPDSQINILTLTLRPLNALNRAGVFTVGQLVSLPYIKVASLPNMGKKGVTEVRYCLAAHGLYLRGEWNSDRGFEEFMSKRDPVNDSPKTASIETGGPAFPVTPTDRSGQIADTEMGMSLRDYFAAKALQGILAGGAINTGIKSKSETAYAYADAMLEARK